MDERQHWIERLDEFLQFRRDGGNAEGTIADDKAVVGQWIGYALERNVRPDERNDELLREWVAAIADLAPLTQDNCRAHMSPWWQWNSDDTMNQPSVRDRPPQNRTDSCGGLFAPDKWGPSYCACGSLVSCYTIDRSAATYCVCRKTGEVVWVGAPINRTVGGKRVNRVVEATKSPSYRIGDTWLGIPRPGVDPGPSDAELSEDTDDLRSRLARLVNEFRKHSHDGEGYPREDDRQQERARAEFERVLQSLPGMLWKERSIVKEVWTRSGRTYGSPGRQPSLSKTINDASEQEWLRIRHCLWELCFGDGDPWDRIDRAVEQVSGLGLLVATRLPAICHPERFIPNYVLARSSSDNWPGKLEMVEHLDRLDLLDESSSREAREILQAHEEAGASGEIVMRSNDLLLNALRDHFVDEDVVDTWGIRSFLYWLWHSYGDDEASDTWALEADLAVLADELLCDVSFVKDIVALLEDKRQVILYGPPGTGKTYFARQLAWTLTGIADDEEYEYEGAYSLVQFHPAYSYEDFFEGFRPQVDKGQLTYMLTSGPLVRLAERAEAHPDELHVMVIDEINRANLPRVLGELLYLLEYRDEWTQTQYRPVDGFVLPSNLWFIGTMNTADRSIALIDAAMRRRFHFVPFFPDREPTAGLLRRWCERNEPTQAWVADLLDAVNERLRADLGGDYMLIGPSHFMKQCLDENGLRRIWEYNIEPLIEDQFFGRQEVIDEYRFSRVWSRHGPSAKKPDTQTGVPNGPVEGADPQVIDGDDAETEEDE